MKKTMKNVIVKKLGKIDGKIYITNKNNSKELDHLKEFKEMLEFYLNN